MIKRAQVGMLLIEPREFGGASGLKVFLIVAIDHHDGHCTSVDVFHDKIKIDTIWRLDLDPFMKLN